MRGIGALGGLSLLLTTLPALADSYAWGGSSRRLEVSVVSMGFHDGAGVGGWDEHDARTFAAIARRFDSLLPPGAFVKIEQGVDDLDFWLTLRRGPRTYIITLPGEVDLERALSVVARRFPKRSVPADEPVELFTLQLFASRSESHANRFVERAERRGLHVEHPFFWQACLPCSIPEARVWSRGTDGWFRVIAGVFDRPANARRALVQLKKQGFDGFVRQL